MGKATGFLEYQREVPNEVEPRERISSWCEFSVPMSEEQLKIQGARCMDCGTPFCHVGRMLSGMASGCPIHNLIPEWNDLVYRGNWKEALKRLQKVNNFPEFTGRVCPAPCEGACTVGKNGSPVTIKNIEKSIIDRGFMEGWIQPEPPEKRTGFKVAVVGSGPAGLACADQLNQAGHTVTVFERADRIGGLLMYGIPNMKLDKSIIERRVGLLEAEGITFVANCEVGKDLAVNSLMKEYDAIVLCGGASQVRDLPVPGREASGIYQAMEFLTLNTRSLLDSGLEDGRYISAKDKHVIVIGGGDTGTDCVATAIRHGCKTVDQLEIMPMPPLNRQADNPWPEWPKVLKTDYGHKEAVGVFGEDPRRYLTATRQFLTNDAGRLTGVEIVDIEWIHNDQGRLIPREIAGTERILQADMVLLALGFTGPEDGLLAQLGIERDERSNVKTADGEYATNVNGIFAAGDMRRGQSLVVWAIQEGRQAAKAVNQYLAAGALI